MSAAIQAHVDLERLEAAVFGDSVHSRGSLSGMMLLWASQLIMYLPGTVLVRRHHLKTLVDSTQAEQM